MTLCIQRLALSASLAVFGCGSGDPPPDSAAGCGFGSVSTAETSGFSEPVPAADSGCGAVVTEEAEALGEHVAECSRVEYATNPPSSGVHYDVWPAFERYDTPVPRGFWVHALEHGAVVFVHNCDDCEDEIEAAGALMDELPEDPLCLGTGAARRAILTPDPALDVRWAASAWGFTLRSDCFEPEVFRSFYVEHYGQGPEDLCARGRQF